MHDRRLRLPHTPWSNFEDHVIGQPEPLTSTVHHRVRGTAGGVRSSLPLTRGLQLPIAIRAARVDLAHRVEEPLLQHALAAIKRRHLKEHAPMLRQALDRRVEDELVLPIVGVDVDLQRPSVGVLVQMQVVELLAMRRLRRQADAEELPLMAGEGVCGQHRLHNHAAEWPHPAPVRHDDVAAVDAESRGVEVPDGAVAPPRNVPHRFRARAERDRRD
mmetsp:Transcript_8187/g.23382  ORF Transcript_8187/g.23382 Transcript_8187/m.23382 type:complete len:217 (-) Transcript_8187:100-750(-)